MEDPEVVDAADGKARIVGKKDLVHHRRRILLDLGRSSSSSSTRTGDFDVEETQTERYSDWKGCGISAGLEWRWRRWREVDVDLRVEIRRVLEVEEAREDGRLVEERS